MSARALDRPLGVRRGPARDVPGFDPPRDLAGRPGHVLVPGHDPVMRRFPVLEGTGGLAARVG